jgi:hypothetical protein
LKIIKAEADGWIDTGARGLGALVGRSLGRIAVIAYIYMIDHHDES